MQRRQLDPRRGNGIWLLGLPIGELMGRETLSHWLHEDGPSSFIADPNSDERLNQGPLKAQRVDGRIVTGVQWHASNGSDQTEPPAMDTPASEVLVPFIVFASIFGVVYIVVTARHRQRMAMIEKGITPTDMMERKDPYRSLKYGLVSVAIGIGLLLGYLLQARVMTDRAEDPLPYFIMVTICAGGALIAHHMIVSKNRERKL